MSKSNVAQKAVKAAHYIKAAIELVTNLLAQNYAGAAWAGVKLLPLIIGIIIFLIIAPLIIFLYLPALIIDSLNPFSSSSTNVTTSYIQENVNNQYNSFNTQIDDLIQSIRDRFNDGELDPDVTYRGYGRNPTFDITRETMENGSQVDTMWLAALLSVYAQNEPDNITSDKTNSFINSIFSYGVTEDITKVTRNSNAPTNLKITRTLNLNFKNPYAIMDILGFSEEQKMWAEFMYSAISGNLENPDYDFDYDYDSDVAELDIELANPFSTSWHSAVTSNFGWRKDPFDGTQSFHRGIDIEKPEGTDIMAVMAGTVSYVHFGTTGYGYVVRIDHGIASDGSSVETLYSHCSAIHVVEGQQVKQGEVIAAVGSTGRSTGPHLHFELRVNSRAINPRPYLP
jgi:murein DD-endopeptidase MepM/ murein hydrolase activator NlpD